MINHIRTLLLDEDGSNKPASNYPLEEFVPTTFKTQRMPSELRKVWHALFGNKPDRAYKNWRLFQLSELAQASDLLEHWYRFDSRVTHFSKPSQDFSTEYGRVLASIIVSEGVTSIALADGPDGLSPVANAEAINSTTNQEALGLNFLGALTADEALGRCYSIWSLQLNPADDLVVQSLSDMGLRDEYSLTFEQGLSQAVTLRGSGLGLKFRDAGAASWNIELAARPSKDLGTVLANLDNIPSYELEGLFSGKSRELATFKNYWTKNDNLAERVTALVLALAFKIEEKRDV